jgi:hypothetical protein
MVPRAYTTSSIWCDLPHALCSFIYIHCNLGSSDNAHQADFGVILPRLSLLATIGFAYSVLSPLINLLALLCELGLLCT